MARSLRTVGRSMVERWLRHQGYQTKAETTAQLRAVLQHEDWRAVKATLCGLSLATSRAALPVAAPAASTNSADRQAEFPQMHEVVREAEIGHVALMQLRMGVPPLLEREKQALKQVQPAAAPAIVEPAPQP